MDIAAEKGWSDVDNGALIDEAEQEGYPCDPPPANTVAEPPAGYGGVGWRGGSYLDYDREWCVDLVQLAAFLRDT